MAVYMLKDSNDAPGEGTIAEAERQQVRILDTLLENVGNPRQEKDD